MARFEIAGGGAPVPPRVLHRLLIPGCFTTSLSIANTIALPTGTSVLIYSYGLVVPQPLLVRSVLYSTGGTAPAGASLNLKLAFYEVDPSTGYPTTQIAGGQTISSIPASTFTRKRQTLSAPVVIDRARAIRICTMFDCGTAGNITAGTMYGTNSMSIVPPSSTTSTGVGDLEISATGLSYAAGLPTDFGLLTSPTYGVMSGGNNPANIDFSLVADV